MNESKEFRCLAIVPARSGSKRIPQKNTRLLSGRPLVEYAIRATMASAAVTRCVVSSDDPRVLAIAAEIDPALALPRPSEIATDESLTIETVNHALAMLEQGGETYFDATIIVQPTAPLVLASDIDRCVEKVRKGADSAVTITRVGPLHPSKLKCLHDGWLEPYFADAPEKEGTRGQELSPAFLRSGSVYVTRREVLLSGSIYGRRVAGVEVPRERSIDIDDLFDWEIAEFLLTRMTKKTNQSFAEAILFPQ